jgi:dTDP-4-amino-4,6-dideoxygalactose transaminase
MPIDLPFHKSWIEEDEIQEVVDTLKSGWLTTGPKTLKFEEDFKDYIGCKHAIGLNSCTAGLHISLALLELERGMEVITTPMTFPATTNVILHQGLHPVFVDIEPGTLTIDASKIEEKITPKTRAIFPVHFAGHPCDMDVIEGLAKQYKLKIVEDAAHALESKYKGRKIGNSGNLTSFSFYANKNITTGEGGMLTTNDDQLAEKILSLRLQGLSRDAWKRYGKSGFSHWELHSPGYKYNLPDINAAMGIHQLKKVNQFFEIRQRYAKIYDEAFSNVEELQPLQVKDYAVSARHIYVIALNLGRLTLTRDEFLDAMQKQGIGVAVHYIPLHLQPYFVKTYGLTPDQFPVATDYSQRILTLPLYPKMSTSEVERVIDTVLKLIQSHRR